MTIPKGCIKSKEVIDNPPPELNKFIKQIYFQDPSDIEDVQNVTFRCGYLSDSKYYNFVKLQDASNTGMYAYSKSYNTRAEALSSFIGKFELNGEGSINH